MNIARENKVTDNDIWDRCLQILAQIDIDGTSSDEYDDEDDVPPSGRAVRRKALPWINSDISKLWKALESYYSSFQSSGLRKKGNRPLIRHYVAKHQSSRKPVASLPRNFYDPLWLATLNEVELEILSPATEVEIPQLVSLRFWSCFHDLIAFIVGED